MIGKLIINDEKTDSELVPCVIEAKEPGVPNLLFPGTPNPAWLHQ